MASESMEIEKFVREQLEKWKVRPTGPIVKAAGTREDCTVITISMEPGSGGRVLAECAAAADELGAEEVELPCPGDLDLAPETVEVLDRRFAFAWLRKRL